MDKTNELDTKIGRKARIQECTRTRVLMSRAPTHLYSIRPSTRSSRSTVVRQRVFKSASLERHTVLNLGRRRLCILAVDEDLVYAIDAFVVGTGHEALHVAIVVGPLAVTVPGDVFESVDFGPGLHPGFIGAG